MSQSLNKTYGHCFSSVALALALVTIGAAPARALDVTSLDFRVDGNDVHIEISASEALSSPRVHSKPGMVRLWFPEFQKDVRLDAMGDGRAIAFARLRPGYDQTGLLTIQIGGRKRVPPELVQVSLLDKGARITIPRSALPEVLVPAPATPLAVAPKQAPQKVQAEEATATDTPSDVPSEPAAPVEPAKGALALLAKSSREGKSASASLALAEQVGPSPRPEMLIGIILLLGAVLLGVKLVQRRRHTLLRRPDIDVVATRRLGAGLQLMVVRAFGRDHLLSVNGKHIQRLASVKAGDPVMSLPSAAQNSVDKAYAPKRDVMGSSAGNIASDFGKLLKLPRKPPSDSEAVAGLVALRARMGK